MKIIATFTERIREAVNESSLKQVDIARRANISRSLMSKYMSGASNAGNVPLYNLASVLNVNVLWLMGYDVPKRDSEERKALKAELTSRFDRLSMNQLEIIKKFIDEFLS